ncbi:MAG: class I SAM-dependent methyltransferase [Candidatus Margulisbacteria bacterium]|jgi:23S rRNA (cytosine1962-C5)-methyltransferase|nr:class I SAM-dependent methyltransferase [Candidatus Margulisiibacteriota bacterium]
MNDHTQWYGPIGNRIKKRYKHLAKWARRQGIDYFRVYDRDNGGPFMIDSLPDHWLIWVCDNNLTDAQLANAIEWVSADLTALKPAKIVLKDRRKDSVKPIGKSQDAWVKIQENNCRFLLNLTRYLDVGLFIDHRNTRQWLGQQCAGKRVLNLYAYTGSFGCYALKHGASFVASVDINPVYNDWNEKNIELNGFSMDACYMARMDAFEFLSRHKRRYDVIICDPPSFSQSKRKGARLFSVKKDAVELIHSCWRLLNPGGQLLFSTNATSFTLPLERMPSDAFIQPMTQQLCPKDFEGKWRSQCWVLRRT